MNLIRNEILQSSVRFGLVAAIGTALLLGIWSLFADVPATIDILVFVDDKNYLVYEPPFAISRWWDIVAVFLAGSFLKTASMIYKKDSDVFVILIVGLFFGAVIFLSLGLVTCLIIGLLSGLSVGIFRTGGFNPISGMTMCLVTSSAPGLFFGLGPGLILGLINTTAVVVVLGTGLYVFVALRLITGWVVSATVGAVKELRAPASDGETT